MGLVRAGQHVVCVQQVHEEFCLKIMAVDAAAVSSGKAHAAVAVSVAAATMGACCCASVATLCKVTEARTTSRDSTRMSSHLTGCRDMFQLLSHGPCTHRACNLG